MAVGPITRDALAVGLVLVLFVVLIGVLNVIIGYT